MAPQMMNPAFYGMQGMNPQFNNPAALYMMDPQSIMDMAAMQGFNFGFDGSGYDQQAFDQGGFDQEMGPDHSEFISMLQMFNEGMQGDDGEDEPEDEDMDMLLEEAEFERQQEEADKFDEESKDCNCCKGYPLKCIATICESLGMCHCRLRRNKEQEPTEKEQQFVEEKKNCSCCKGHIFNCKGLVCVNAGQCQCMAK